MKKFAVVINTDIVLFVEAWDEEQALRKIADHMDTPVEVMRDNCYLQDISNIQSI